MKAIVMLLCPVVGPTFLCAAFLLYKLFMSQAMDLSDVVFSKERVKTFIPPDEERGRNMVSIEEALEVTDKKSLRTFMMNVIRGDYRKYLSSISLALNNEDTETAHYAASILQDVLGEFRGAKVRARISISVGCGLAVADCVSDWGSIMKFLL